MLERSARFGEHLSNLPSNSFSLKINRKTDSKPPKDNPKLDEDILEEDRESMLSAEDSIPKAKSEEDHQLRESSTKRNSSTDG